MTGALFFGYILLGQTNPPASDLRKLDTFASNFAEAGTPPFTSKTLTNKIMLDFALRHCQINKEKDWIRTGERFFVSRSTMQSTIKRFFGKSVPVPKVRYEVWHGEGDSLAESRVFKITGSYPKQFALYAIDYISTIGAGNIIEDPSEAKVLRHVKISAKASTTEKGRFIITGLATLSKATWQKESGQTSTAFVRPL